MIDWLLLLIDWLLSVFVRSRKGGEILPWGGNAGADKYMPKASHLVLLLLRRLALVLPLAARDVLPLPLPLPLRDFRAACGVVGQISMCIYRAYHN